MPEEIAAVAEATPPETFTPPEPVKTTPREAVEEKKPLSLKDSIKAARDKIEAKDAAEVDPKALKAKEPAKAADKSPKSEAEPSKSAPKSSEQAPTTERPRGEHGHFTADPAKTDAENEAARVAASRAEPVKKGAQADPTDHKQPLQRFSQAAKDAWPTVPEEAQKEIHRAFREVEAGLTKHREGSTRYNEVFKEFDDIAKTSNVDAKATLQSYVNIDRALHSGNPQQVVGAINEVLKSAGIEAKQYAQAILGNGAQTQQPNGAQPSAEVVELRKMVSELKSQIGGVSEHLQSQTMERHKQTLDEWGADKPHLTELLPEVRRLVADEGLLPDDAYASALVAAQEKARALLGDSALKTPSSDNPYSKAAVELAEQIDKGSKSIKGAPSAGSEPPPTQGKLPSIKESLRKARLKVSA